MLDTERVAEAERSLHQLLGPQLARVVELLAASEHNPFTIQLPEAYDVDLPMDQLLSLVARTSNKYGECSRIAGMARADAKILRGRYERKFKRSRRGKSDAERDANAMDVCHDDHVAMVTAEAVAELAESMESSTRIASESIRKIADKAAAMAMAAAREQRGSYQERDFKPWVPGEELQPY